MESTASTEDYVTMAGAPSEASRLHGDTPAIQAPTVATGAAQCPQCGAPLASDQRYCVECGERRSGVRLPFANASAARGQSSAARVRASRRLRMSPNSTLIAGIATLLLAMGIGVLIGRSGSSSGSRGNAGVQVVTVAGAGSGSSAAAGSTGAGAAGSGATGSSGSTSAGGSTNPALTSTPKGTANKNVHAPGKVVSVGSKGSGPGYQNGKFTGNFFGQ